MNIDREKVTAYALGELEGDEKKLIEKLIEENKEAREYVEEMQRAADLITMGFSSVDEPGLTKDNKQMIAQEAKLCAVREKRMKIVSWSVPVAAAAVVLFLFAFFTDDTLHRVPVKTYEEKFDAIAYLKQDDENWNAMESRYSAVLDKIAEEAGPAPLPETRRAKAGYEKKALKAVRAPVDIAMKTEEVAGPEPAMTLGDEMAMEPEGLRDEVVILADGRDTGIAVAMAPKGRSGGKVPVSNGVDEQIPVAYGGTAVLSGYDAQWGAADDLSGAVPGRIRVYDVIPENPFLSSVSEPVSTLSVDVDTASYSNMRRFINMGVLPPRGSVRIEEFLNYFVYDCPRPKGSVPFSVSVEIATCPWNERHRLAKIGIRGRDVPARDRQPANLVFLIDSSSSMDAADKLPLVQKSVKMFVNDLGRKDQVSLVAWSDPPSVVLPATSGTSRYAITSAVDSLNALGSDNTIEGVKLAYETVEKHFIKGGSNGIILCTDGDLETSLEGNDDLVELVEKKTKDGVFLNVMGYGMDGSGDAVMERIAAAGNGRYSFIDTKEEARKVLRDQVNGTIVTIAEDVKIQLEFNPGKVSSYRLIGYENRLLGKDDFDDERTGAGDIGAGHTITVLYELVPHGDGVPVPDGDGLRYQQPIPLVGRKFVKSDESFYLKLRYTEPAKDVSRLMTLPVKDRGRHYKRASDDFLFAASVASYGMMLRGSQYRGEASYDDILELAKEGLGVDRYGYRREFIKLLLKARQIDSQR